MLYLYRL